MCPHSLGLSHLVVDALMLIPFLGGIVFYLKSKFKIPWKYRNGDICLAQKLEPCEKDLHHFYQILTKNGYRVDAESPCQCHKYPDLPSYSMDVDKDI